MIPTGTKVLLAYLSFSLEGASTKDSQPRRTGLLQRSTPRLSNLSCLDPTGGYRVQDFLRAYAVHPRCDRVLSLYLTASPGAPQPLHRHMFGGVRVDPKNAQLQVAAGRPSTQRREQDSESCPTKGLRHECTGYAAWTKHVSRCLVDIRKGEGDESIARHVQKRYELESV